MTQTTALSLGKLSIMSGVERPPGLVAALYYPNAKIQYSENAMYITEMIITVKHRILK